MGVHSLLLCKAWQDVGCKTRRVLSKPSGGSRSSVCVTEHKQQLHRGSVPLHPRRPGTVGGLERNVPGGAALQPLADRFPVLPFGAVRRSCSWRGAVELNELGSTKCSDLRRSDSSSHLRNDGCVCMHESRGLNGSGQIQALCVWRGDWGCVIREIVRLEVTCETCSSCTAVSDAKWHLLKACITHLRHSEFIHKCPVLWKSVYSMLWPYFFPVSLWAFKFTSESRRFSKWW